MSRHLLLPGALIAALLPVGAPSARGETVHLINQTPSARISAVLVDLETEETVELKPVGDGSFRGAVTFDSKTWFKRAVLHVKWHEVITTESTPKDLDVDIPLIIRNADRFFDIRAWYEPHLTVKALAETLKDSDTTPAFKLYFSAKKFKSVLPKSRCDAARLEYEAASRLSDDRSNISHVYISKQLYEETSDCNKDILDNSDKRKRTYIYSKYTFWNDPQRYEDFSCSEQKILFQHLGDRKARNALDDDERASKAAEIAALDHYREASEIKCNRPAPSRRDVRPPRAATSRQ